MKYGLLILIAGISALITTIVFGFKVNYELQNNVTSYWELADRASTIEQKSVYMDSLVMAYEGANLQGQYNALIFKTPADSYDKNIEALKSLKSRLESIQCMNRNSFEYQTALQQITGQEMGEAQPMLDVLNGCWLRVKHPMFWAPYAVMIIIAEIIMLLVGVIIVTTKLGELI